MVGHSLPPMWSLIMDNQDGYSGFFYFMLLIGLIGLIGFVITAAGAGS